MGCSHPRVLRESRAYLVLLRVGFTRLPRSLGVPVGSYPAFSTLPTKALALKFGVKSSAFGVLLRTHHSKLLTLREAEQAVSFLWHFPYPAKQALPPLHGAVRVTDHPALWSSDFPLPRLSVSGAPMGSDPLFPLLSPSLVIFDHRPFNRLVRQAVRLLV
jgi:hypothetical protein